MVAEDRQQEMFLRRVLYAMGLTVRDLRFETCPKASQAGDAWVLHTHAEEVAKLRVRQHAQPDLGLVTAIDADAGSVQDRHRQLDATAAGARAPTERIAFVVPRRNIETWLRVLAGHSTNEEEDYKKRGQAPIECSVEAETFVKWCAESVKEILPAMRVACLEIRRVCS